MYHFDVLWSIANSAVIVHCVILITMIWVEYPLFKIIRTRIFHISDGFEFWNTLKYIELFWQWNPTLNTIFICVSLYLLHMAQRSFHIAFLVYLLLIEILYLWSEFSLCGRYHVSTQKVSGLNAFQILHF